MNLDFTNVQEWDPTRGGGIEPGVYPVQIDEVDDKHNGGKSTTFEVTTLPGGTGPAGQKTMVPIGNEPGAKGGNVKKWKTALMSVATSAGKSEDDARAMFSKQISFDPVKSFKGKKAYIIVTANDSTYTDATTGATKKSGPDREFMTRGQFEAALAAAKANGGTLPAKTTNGASGGQTPAAAGGAPAAAGGDVMDDIFGK